MNKIFDKAITTRFSLEDYSKLEEEAEKRACSVASVIRSSWQSYHRYQHYQQQLLRMEQRQRAFHFELLCSLLDLNSAQRRKALESLIDKGVKL